MVRGDQMTDDPIAIMQSAQLPDTRTEEQIALTMALNALRHAKPANGDGALAIRAAKLRIVEVLKAA
jgi:hypothetical protein